MTTACSDIKPVTGTMKVHAVFPHAPNKIWVKDTSCFDRCCYNGSFQLNSACEGWRLVNLKGNDVECTEYQSKIEDVVVPDVNDFVAAVYDRKVYVGRAIEVDDSDANISFYKHSGEITKNSAFREPDIKDEVWVDFANIICILPEPSETKRGRKFDEAVINNLR